VIIYESTGNEASVCLCIQKSTLESTFHVFSLSCKTFAVNKLLQSSRLHLHLHLNLQLARLLG